MESPTLSDAEEEPKPRKEDAVAENYIYNMMLEAEEKQREDAKKAHEQTYEVAQHLYGAFNDPLPPEARQTVAEDPKEARRARRSRLADWRGAPPPSNMFHCTWREGNISILREEHILDENKRCKHCNRVVLG